MDKPQVTIIQEPGGQVSISAKVPDRDTLLLMLAAATLGILQQSKEPEIVVASTVPTLLPGV